MEIGLYLALSTTHLRCASAALLERWAGTPSPARPLLVASTQLGWFVPTRSLPAATLDQLPAELPAILAFGRRHRCDYILFDCDASAVDELPVFPW